MQIISIIRDRGQLTIPDSIRQMVGWVNPSSAVSITVTKSDEIVIRPHVQAVNHSEIWGKIKQARAIKGKGRLSGQEFLEAERSSR